MKKTIILFLLSFKLILCYGQKVSIKWGETTERNMMLESIVNGEGSDMVKLSHERLDENEKADHKSSNLFKSVHSFTPFLRNYNAGLEETNSVAITLKDETEGARALLNVKGNLFLIKSRYADKDVKTFTDFFCQPLKQGSLLPSKEEIPLGSTFDPYYVGLISPSYWLSQDSSHIMMFNINKKYIKDIETFTVNVYSSNMILKWTRRLELPYPKNAIKIVNTFVTNDGTVGIVIKHCENELSDKWKNAWKPSTKPFKTRVLLYAKNDEQPKQYTIDIDGKFTLYTQLANNGSGNLAIFGLCADQPNGRYTGYFTAIIDPQKNEEKTIKFAPFPKNVIDQVENHGQGGLKGLDPHFTIAKILTRNNGSIDYLLEYGQSVFTGDISTVSFPHGERDTRLDYKYGDIIDINIAANGTANVICIPKMQTSYNTEIFSHFIATLYNDYLLLFYNDSKGNINKNVERGPSTMDNSNQSVLVMAKIDSNGGLERSIVDENNDKMATTVQKCVLIGKNRIGLYGYKPNFAPRGRVGILEIN